MENNPQEALKGQNRGESSMQIWHTSVYSGKEFTKTEI